MTLRLGFSPCPNDTFLFYALIHQQIDTEGLRFEVRLDDVEALNQAAFRRELDVTKLSYHAYTKVLPHYVLLDSGSALGNNCGPLLIAKGSRSVDELRTGPIAIPGRNTTANFLLSLAYPQAQNRREYLFSDIEGAVLRGEVVAGLIIHENRFTYREKGLHKIVDLGEFWESTTQLPIPLGGIGIRRSLPLDVQQKVNRVLQRSVRYAFDHPEATKPYVRAHAQEMSEEVMFQHIDLYVNQYTEQLGQKGRRAVRELFAMAQRQGVLAPFRESLFLPEV
ncbi:MAG: 1,4-dihydroxy-6-naphthoate synthase [Bacteroidota bacterium]